MRDGSSPGEQIIVTPVSADVTVYTFTARQSSHLIVHRGASSVLIDCHDATLADRITSLGLPAPAGIFHTHIQPEHTRQGDAFGQTPIHVHEDLRILAGDRAAYDRLIRTTWDDPMDWPNSAGQEPFGVAGSVTRLPPERPLENLQFFRPGDKIILAGLSLEVISLPGHGGSQAVGFVAYLDGQPAAAFTGDLLCHGPCLPNIYDLEYAYGRTYLPQLPATLRAVADLGGMPFFPATGAPLPNGPSQARQLADAIDAYHHALSWRSELFTPVEPQQPAMLGRWLHHGPGIYQLSNYGNVIVLIDDAGRGLMVDPGPCDFGDDRRTARFHKDLDMLHQKAGLAVIDRILLTHFHGDHLDMVHEMRGRYPHVRVAAWDVLADVIASPSDYPYPCMLPWYNLGSPSAVATDDRLSLGGTHHWHDVAIETIHLPGHCFVHAGHVMDFRGQRIAITGDTIQDRDRPAGLEFIIANDSVPDDHRGQLKGLRLLLARDIDLNLGGHSSFFRQPRQFYAETIRRIEHAQPMLRRLVPHGDLHGAFHRPWFPTWEGRV